jgi:hypothetical protein
MSQSSAQEFWEQYDIPISFGACIKVRMSGLQRGSWGDGRARDTVTHLHVKEGFTDGRLSRESDTILCDPDSHVDEMMEEDPTESGLPKPVTCETCLKRMERWEDGQ